MTRADVTPGRIYRFGPRLVEVLRASSVHEDGDFIAHHVDPNGKAFSFPVRAEELKPATFLEILGSESLFGEGGRMPGDCRHYSGLLLPASEIEAASTDDLRTGLGWLGEELHAAAYEYVRNHNEKEMTTSVLLSVLRRRGASRAA